MAVDTKTHPIYSKDATVHLATAPDKFQALQNAIDASDFMGNVEAGFERSEKTRDDFLIVVKPNIMTAAMFEDPSPVYTDPQLVEYLFDRLRDRGFQRFAIVESHNVYDYSYQGRTVRAVAEMVGFSDARGYSIENLTEQPEPFDYGGVLGEHSVGRTWRNADYRISFAKNKTHWGCFYTGCMKNVYGCLPEWDKMMHYHGKGREFFECNILILDAFPVHFGFLDAWVSGDGWAGHVRDARPNHTKTIFACENILALDWIMGVKMGIDPMKNLVVIEALKRWTKPGIVSAGDMTPWKPWANVRPIMIAVQDRLEEIYWVSRFSSRALASGQDKRFPPISRWQWLFRLFQRITGVFQRIFENRT